MNTLEAYNLLFAGKKILANFESPVQAQTFRIKLHHLKTKQENYMLSIGAINEEDVFVFSCLQKNERQWELSFIKSKKMKDYDMIVIEDSSENGSSAG